MEQEDEVFREALVGKKIPILTLDNQWHKLFTQAGENEEIQRLEEELNEVLKRQGKLNTELKSLAAFKKKLMQEIVSIMELPDSSAKEKKMEEKEGKRGTEGGRRCPGTASLSRGGYRRGGLAGGGKETEPYRGRSFSGTSGARRYQAGHRELEYHPRRIAWRA